MLCVGNELLIGRTLNTNASRISSELHRIGVWVSRHTVVGDDVDGIAEAVKEALDRSADFLIISGGLGPTYDDKTLQGLAKALNRRLVVNRKALSMIKTRYKKMAEKGIIPRFEITPYRLKMATLPAYSRALPNPLGTAPAVMVRHNATTIFCLPGVPSELESILADSVIPMIKRSVGELYTTEALLEYQSRLLHQPWIALFKGLVGCMLRASHVALRGIRLGLRYTSPLSALAE